MKFFIAVLLLVCLTATVNTFQWKSHPVRSSFTNIHSLYAKSKTKGGNTDTKTVTVPVDNDQREFQGLGRKERESRTKVDIVEQFLKTDDAIGDQSAEFKSGFISIVGNANMGKSTLMNAFLGEKLCIVSPKPQTTRHRILGIVTEKDYQLVFSDTPGMLSPSYKLQETMQDTIRGATGDADVILVVTDVYGESLMDETIMQKLTVTDRSIIVVINKIDLVNATSSGKFSLVKPVPTPNPNKATETPGAIQSFKEKLMQRKLIQKTTTNNNKEKESTSEISTVTTSNPNSDSESESEDINSAADYSLFHRGEPTMAFSRTDLEILWKQRLPKADIVSISAYQKTGLDPLLETIISKLKPGPKFFPSDTFTTRDERFFTSEIIREQLLESFRDEIPYSCEVVIDQFRDKTEQFSSIEATIIVSRESQKMIVIGKGGAKVKEIGIKAREKLEDFLQRKVYLGLKVKVDSDWRSNGDSLLKYGYIEKD